MLPIQPAQNQPPHACPIPLLHTPPLTCRPFHPPLTAQLRHPQDGPDPDVKKVAMHYAVETMGIVRLLHHGKNASALLKEDPSSSPEKCSTDPGRPAHQLFLLRVFFECFQYPALLVLRDDARLAPDALALFAGAQWLLTSDPSLWCVNWGRLRGWGQVQGKWV